MLQDMAILTGAQVVSDELGLKLDSVDMSVLGTAKKVIVSKDETTIVSGGGDKADVEARVAQIRAEIEKTDSDYDREKLQERLAKLAGGVAVIKVGAATEVEAKERKHRIEDAVRNAKGRYRRGPAARRWRGARPGCQEGRVRRSRHFADRRRGHWCRHRVPRHRSPDQADRRERRRVR